MSSLGDVIHTLPALTDAAAALPGVRFDWVVEEAFAEVPRWHPAVDRVIPVALRRWRRHPLRELRGPGWRAARSALRARGYTALIDAQGLLKSAFIALQVNAPRHGMDWRSAREGVAAAAYHHRHPVPREMHAIQRLRMLFASALGYPCPGGDCDYGLAGPFSPDPVATSAPLVFCHGTARAEKLWPEAHWVELAALAAAQGHAVVLPQGSDEEAARARRIAAAGADCAGEIRVLPRCDLNELARLLGAAQAAVAVDTGLGHLCAALDLPTVSLYGPTTPRRVGALGHGQVHLCAAPGGAMATIAPAAVWAALGPLLQQHQHSAAAGS